MVNKSETTYDRIVGSGLEIVSEGGLAGVSLGGLASRVGMSKSGLFAHFRSKEELQLALLRASEDLVKREVFFPALEEPEGLPRLRTLMRRWLGWAKRAGLPGGCPHFAAAFELDDAEGPVRDYLTGSLGELWKILEGLVKEAMKLGHLRKDLDAAQFVWEMEGIYLSHHVSQRLMRSPDADERAYRAFEALVSASQDRSGS